MSIKSSLFYFSSFILLSFTVYNGGSYQFNNPSFEDTPRASASPKGWSSETAGSTPDIMPGAWGIDFKPQDGKSCLGLIARKDGTREDVGQSFETPLPKNNCYTFTIYLAHASYYVGFDKPLRLRVWGGASKGVKSELLYASPLIDHHDWKQYKIEIEPKSDVKHITFEAYFGPGVMRYYDGNILLDNLSIIDLCDRA